MKKFMLLAAMLLVGAFAASAQTATVSEKSTFSNGNYTTVSTRSSGDSKDVETPYTWSSSRDSVSHKIYLHQYSRGDNAGQWTAYVFRISKKTGKEYKYYLPDGQAIAADIRKRMNLK